MSTATGTGGNPELGEQAAQESLVDLQTTTGGADMVRLYIATCRCLTTCTIVAGTAHDVHVRCGLSAYCFVCSSSRIAP